jgi:hypothetical protein
MSASAMWKLVWAILYVLKKASTGTALAMTVSWSRLLSASAVRERLRMEILRYCRKIPQPILLTRAAGCHGIIRKILTSYGLAWSDPSAQHQYKRGQVLKNNF